MSAMHANGTLIHHPCTVCCRPTSMWCSRCQLAWYCSPEHLQNDWPRHRRECMASPNQHMVIQTPPAAPEMMQVSAILFNPSEERSQIINVNCQLTRRPNSSSCPTPLVDSFFQESQPASLVLTQGLNGEPLRFPLHIFYCPLSLQRGQPVNRAIYRITSGAAARNWPGPVVVLKFNGSRRQSYTDAINPTAMSANGPHVQNAYQNSEWIQDPSVFIHQNCNLITWDWRRGRDGTIYYPDPSLSILYFSLHH